MAKADARGITRLPWHRRWLAEHGRALMSTLSELIEQPLSTLTTAAVIGIALALPMGLYLGVTNLSGLSYGWEGVAQATLFLKDSVDEAQGIALSERTAARPGLEAVQYISRAAALEEFRAASGFGDALDVLEDNPLPAAIVVVPDPKLAAQQVATLLDELAALPEVDFAQRDQQWLERLYAMLELLRRTVALLAILLGIAVAITVGNTVRLELEGRREEILVLKLIGAPMSFIRRPFLYTGLWYGFLGSFVALLLVGVAGLLLSKPVLRLAGLYETQFELQGPNGQEVLAVIGTGILLGLLGAWTAIQRHLATIEPV